VEKTSRKEWYLYMLRCRDGSLYTGITTDVQRRVDRHNEGKASRYTRSRRPATPVHSEKCRDKADALKKEFAMKKRTKKEKEDYVREHGKGDRS